MGTNITNNVKCGALNEPRLNSSGQAALPTILLISGIVMEIVVTLTFIVYLILSSGLGERLSAQALAAARSGAADAIMRVIWDKSFNHSGYNINVGSRTANVVVENDTPAPGKTQITSTGTAITRRRRIQAVVVVASSTGEVRLESLQEIE